MESLEVLQKMGIYRYFSDLPYLGRNLVLFLCGLMIVELIVENVQLRIVRNKMKKSV
jgi:hypothetical protein